MPVVDADTCAVCSMDAASLRMVYIPRQVWLASGGSGGTPVAWVCVSGECRSIWETSTLLGMGARKEIPQKST